MPILQNAKKALRASKKKTEFNSRVRSILKTMTDKLKKTPTALNLQSAYSAVDTAVKKKLMHKNKAARLKSQLSKLAAPAKAEKSAPAAKKKTAPTEKVVAKKTVSKKPTAKKKAVAKKTVKK